jgi:phosphate acetyltransferase
MKLIDRIIEKAKQNIKTIVLPEGKDKRVQDAARVLNKEGIVKVIILVNSVDLNDDIISLQSEGIRVEVIEQSQKLHDYSSLLYELRKAKGMTSDKANELVRDSIYHGVLMVKNGDADGMVAGAITSTGDVFRAALQVLKTAKDVKIVSTFFLMDVPDSIYGSDGIFAFSDCGLIVKPKADELVEIAIQTAKSFESLTHEEPIIAMLSYSTFGSAKGDNVLKVVEATKAVQQRYPNLKIDGELQLDAAIVPEVAKIKAPNSSVAGKANVLIFPDLQSGNIGYKLVQRLAKADAYGPLTQGLGGPVNDLSRGCSSDDIVAVAAITSLQSI